MSAPEKIPVILFTYARPAHVARALACLKENRVPVLYVFADGAKGAADAAAVQAVRALIRSVDWCEVHLTERPENLGLGRNVLAGVTEVAGRHDAFIVWEDDLICVPGTYDWLCAALRRYAGEKRVMSVTAWTHPRVTPPGLRGRPYFDRRGECWVWGTWANRWQGVNEQTALEKMAATVAAGTVADAYGADLVDMARVEQARNIWAVRWLYHHLQHGGLCLRPPQSFVEHIGFDATATNASGSSAWANPALPAAAELPASWPEPAEHPWCARLWQVAAPAWPSRSARLRTRLGRLARRLVPAGVLRWRRQQQALRWSGEYRDWAAASAASAGYAAPEILARVDQAVRAVRTGAAIFERDGVAFREPPPAWPVLDELLALAERQGGRLTVLDVGGGLGGSYFNYQYAWAGIPQLHWRVIEQPAFVAAGRRDFADDRLEFFDSAATALAAGVPDVLLLASVLPYVPAPPDLLRTLLAVPYRFILVERTALASAARDRLTVQHVPASLGGGSYPCWVLSREQLLAHFQDYRLVRDEAAAEGAAAEGVAFRNLWFVREEGK